MLLLVQDVRMLDVEKSQAWQKIRARHNGVGQGRAESDMQAKSGQGEAGQSKAGQTMRARHSRAGQGGEGQGTH